MYSQKKLSQFYNLFYQFRVYGSFQSALRELDMDKRKIDELYKDTFKSPFLFIMNTDPEIVTHLMNRFRDRENINLPYEMPKCWVSVLKGEERTEVDVLDLDGSILYHELLKSGCDGVVRCAGDTYKKDETIRYYDQDIWSTVEEYWNEQGELYISYLEENGGVFKKALWTEEKGYFIKGEINHSEKRYNDYCLKLKGKFYRVGNLITHSERLKDFAK